MPTCTCAFAGAEPIRAAPAIATVANVDFVNRLIFSAPSKILSFREYRVVDCA
jgi:hypothetical protein